jgi:hypothetical protein
MNNHQMMSFSMHEMYEIDDLKSFDDAMGDINSSMPNLLLLAPRPSSPSSSTSSSDSLNWLKHTPFENGSGSSSNGGGMRRCTSMAVLPDVERQKKTFSLLTLMTETEEMEDELDTSIMHALPTATGKLFLDEPSRGGTIGSSSNNGAIRSSSPPSPGEEDVTNSANRRPSRRSQGPLKSSLKRSITTSIASSTLASSVQSGEEEEEEEVSSSNADAMKRNVSSHHWKYVTTISHWAMSQHSMVPQFPLTGNITRPKL